MATINIAFGGQNIGVEIPDIALESTMQDLLKEASAQKQLLSNIAQKLDADTIQQVSADRENTKEIVRALKEGDKSLANRLGEYSMRTTKNLNNAIIDLKGDEKFSDLASGFAGALGFGALGAQLGTLFGILEEFGHTMGNLRRVGTGYLDNLQELRNSTAEIGLGLEGFGALVAENGITIKALGENTTEGSTELIKMVKMFRENTKAAGYFGLSSQEMARLLVDEAELRRRSLGVGIADLKTKNEMVKSVEDQLKLNEAVAKLTGQDIRDRIKASQQFKSDAVNAALMSRMTDQQRKATEGAIQSLTQLGPSAQGGIGQAITNMLSGFDMFNNNDAFRGFVQMADSAGLDVRDSIANIVGMINSGADPKEIQAATDVLASSIKNIDGDALDMLITQAQAGNEGAQAVLTARMETVSSGAETMADAVGKIGESMDELNSEIARGTTELAGTMTNLETTAQQFRNVTMNSVLKAFGGDLEGNAAAFTKFVESLGNLPTSDRFQKFSELVSEIVALGTGATALFNVMTKPVDELTTTDGLMLGSLLLSPISPDAANALRASGLLNESPKLLNDVSEVVSPGNPILTDDKTLSDIIDDTTQALKVLIVGDKTKQSSTTTTETTTTETPTPSPHPAESEDNGNA